MFLIDIVSCEAAFLPDLRLKIPNLCSKLNNSGQCYQQFLHSDHYTNACPDGVSRTKGKGAHWIGKHTKTKNYKEKGNNARGEFNKNCW